MLDIENTVSKSKMSLPKERGRVNSDACVSKCDRCNIRRRLPGQEKLSWTDVVFAPRLSISHRPFPVSGISFMRLKFCCQIHKIQCVGRDRWGSLTYWVVSGAAKIARLKLVWDSSSNSPKDATKSFSYLCVYLSKSPDHSSNVLFCFSFLFSSSFMHFILLWW